jgi:hypothetical protein
MTAANIDRFRRNAHCSCNNKPKTATAEITPNTINEAIVEFGLSFPVSFLLRIVIATMYRNTDAAAAPIIAYE